MVDVEAAILEELDRLAPPEHGVSADWAAVVSRARTPRREHRHRRRVAVLIPLLLAALLTPALTLSARVRSLVGLAAGPRPVLARSHLVVSGPIGEAYFAHVWASPASRGGSCAFVAVDRSPTTPAHAPSGQGAICITHPNENGHAALFLDGPWTVATAGFPLAVELSIEPRPAGDSTRWIPPYVDGAVYAGLHATRVRLEWRGGSEALALSGNHFVGGGPVLYKPPFGHLPYYVVAYNAAGREVARHKLNDPSLYLVDEGWKSFTPLYRAWKHAHPNAK